MSVTSRRAVFLDRDGTLIEDRHYLSDPSGVELLPGVPDALRTIRKQGLATVVITNQSGIGRGLIRPAAYRRVEHEVNRRLEQAGTPVDGTYHCPDLPASTPPRAETGRAPQGCRKPSPFMYRRAARDLGLTLEGSFFVGDKASDVLPARRFGGTGILVLTGYGPEYAGKLDPEFLVAEDLAVVAAMIAQAEGARVRRNGLFSR